MKIHEILCEQNHEDQARDALITLLTTQHALGIPETSMQQLLQSLEDRNFFMDADWIQQQISDIPVVDMDASDDDTVVLKLPRTSSASTSANSTQKSQDQDPDIQNKVKNMAQKALAKRMS